VNNPISGLARASPMHLVESVSEVGAAVNRAKQGSLAYCSNFFPVTRNLENWITHRELFLQERDGVSFFFRKDRDFLHLYFCAASLALLQRAIANSPTLGSEPVVLDLVGKESALGELLGLFEGAGFRIHNRLFRMARLVPSVPRPADKEANSRVAVADKSDGQPIVDLLLRSFDRHAEQIPMLYEIEAAVAAGQIWVVRDGGVLAGLLFHETQGLTSTLRYWLVAPQFRSQRFGSWLMHRYFEAHPVIRRFLLWVVAANTDAIGKYEHYGFAPEGLVDYVLANENILP